MSKPWHKVLSPTGILGYGFPEDSFARGMALQPDLIAVDAGSTDPGPYYLGSGKSFTSRAAVKRDLAILVAAAITTSTPLIVGTAGGSGARPHVEWARGIIEELACELGLRFRMAVIYSDFERGPVLDALAEGRLKALFPGPEPTPEVIRRSVRIVAQMGVEPVLAAMEQDPQVILLGRAYDPVSFAAPAIHAGYDPGLALHMGKILECAAIAATPGSGRDCVLGTLYDDHFTLQSLNPARRFTPVSTAAHSLYEKSDPYVLPGPGGILDLKSTTFAALDDARVTVAGSKFLATRPYTLKLEGAGLVGFRTISIAGVRDPVLIRQLDEVLAAVKAQVEEESGPGELLFHVYGRDAVMGTREPERSVIPIEVGLVIEAVSPTAEGADVLCSSARSTLLHYGYPGRTATAGNLALLYSPSDLPQGEVYEFTLYHLLEVDDPVRPFPIEHVEVAP